jgi:hypothetical protein
VYQDGELYHYGVLGMKWGVRRGRTAKAYEKASKKLQKLDKKADKRLEKAYNARDYAYRKMDGSFSTERGIRKANARANEAMRKATQSANKARRWVRSMDKTFANTGVKLTQEQIDIGRKYTELMDKRVFR